MLNKFKTFAVLSSFFCFLILFSGIFTSCSVDLTLALQKDGSVNITFAGGSGQAFTKMILSATGGEEQFLDTKEIDYELSKNGFTNVKSESKKTGEIRIFMTDAKQSSYIFKSGIALVEGNQLKLNITKKSLVDFYNSADEQTRMVLDLFLAPVFNDEEMTEAEYLETLGTFYGKEAAKEVADSFVNITLIDEDGKSQKQKIPFSRLMCGISTFTN